MKVKKKIIAKKKVVKKAVKRVVKKSASKKKSLLSPKKTVRRKRENNNLILENNLEANIPPSKHDDEYGYSLNGQPSYMEEDDTIYSWDAPEFLYHEKSSMWHVVVYSSVVFITAFMFFLKQWLAIPVFILIAVVIYQYAGAKPKNINISINNLGIFVKDKFYPFSEMKSFWILYDPPLKQLNFEITKRFSPVITVLLNDADTTIIKDIFSEQVVEDEQRSEDLFDKLIRTFKF